MFIVLQNYVMGSMTDNVSENFENPIEESFEESILKCYSVITSIHKTRITPLIVLIIHVNQSL